MNKVYGLFANVTDDFCDELAAKLQGQKVLEVFGGNGYLANELSKRNVEIKSTSILSSMDGHDINLFHPVENLDAVSAVMEYGDDYDVLLMAYPTVTERAITAVMAWGDKKNVVYIGERATKEMTQQMLFSGCGSDSLHYSLEAFDRLASYKPKSMMDCAILGRFNFAKLSDFLFDNDGSHYWLS